ncbi:plant cysteine oxidase 1-like isoform X2 [Ananas comosus]|uniref:cysteine dioxygenase n=1 Tax=Ananas comosus TaxID=4615 RepID=A0A6P5F2Z3_ANACO|nr:plant cysteine oxidase 1-like isoform X2 [Ananas comosus]
MALQSMGMSKIQELYDACDWNFSSGKEGLPTLKQIRWLQGLLDAMEPADVGIDATRTDERLMEDEPIPKSQYGLFLAQSVTQVTYIHIHECDDFSIGVFCFPAGATFPLHDHPNMVVLSKVLYGSVQLKSYDWVTTPNSRPKKSGLARIAADDRVMEAPCKASVLFPRSGGNIHSFTAITPCAVLDILAPPYSDERERPSTYFNEIPIPSLPGCAILEETDLPEDFTVVGAPYVGPELTVEMEDYY